MMNNKRAFPSEHNLLHGPAKKRSFLGPGRGGIVRDHVVSMSNEDLNAIKVELKQGLYHIGEALRIAQEATTDIFCVQSISDARDSIQRFVRTTVGKPNIEKRDRLPSPWPSKTGWNPMGSQFRPFGVLVNRGRGFGRGFWRGRGRGRGRVRGRGRGRGRARGRGRGGFFGGNQFKPNRKAVIKRCDICDCECNSLQQWEEHLQGQSHRARIGGKEPPTKTNKTLLIMGSGGDDGKHRITCQVCDIALLEVDYKQHVAGKRHKNNVEQAKESELMFSMNGEFPGTQRNLENNGMMHEVAVGKTEKNENSENENIW